MVEQARPTRKGRENFSSIEPGVFFGNLIAGFFTKLTSLQEAATGHGVSSADWWEKRNLFESFRYYQNDLFTKTGSGQT